MRFGDYGIVFVTRGPIQLNQGQLLPALSFKADYLVLGSSIIMSRHVVGVNGHTIIQITGVAVTNDTFEAISFYTGLAEDYVGHEISMRRQ